MRRQFAQLWQNVERVIARSTRRQNYFSRAATTGARGCDLVRAVGAAIGAPSLLKGSAVVALDRLIPTAYHSDIILRRQTMASTNTADLALVAEDLTKRFGRRTAVDSLSLSVAKGEVFGFLGPNGAGKTTTVRMLGTLIAPSSGSATVAGLALVPANGVEIRQRISVMPESPGLYLRLSVAENLECFAGLYGLADPGPRIQGALEAVNMASRANDACGTLSKGLRQRVGLARVLLNEPEVLFLDEPTSGLDPVATREVHELVGKMRNGGRPSSSQPTASKRPSGSATGWPSSPRRCALSAGPTSCGTACSRSSC